MQRILQATRRIALLGSRSQSTTSSSVGPSLAATGLRYDPAQLPEDRMFDRRSMTEEEFARTLVRGRSAFPATLHPKTHGIPVATIHFRSYTITDLKLFTHFALHAASSLGIPTSNIVSLPTQRTLWTVPRSPFAHKKSQENFDRKTHKRLIKAWDAHPEVVQRWIKYLRKHHMGAVGMRVVTWERLPVGLGEPTIIGSGQEPAATPEETQEPQKSIPSSS